MESSWLSRRHYHIFSSFPRNMKKNICSMFWTLCPKPHPAERDTAWLCSRESGVPACGRRAAGAAGGGARSSGWGSCRRGAAAERPAGLRCGRCDPPLPPGGTCTERCPRRQEQKGVLPPSCTITFCLLFSCFLLFLLFLLRLLLLFPLFL